MRFKKRIRLLFFSFSLIPLFLVTLLCVWVFTDQFTPFVKKNLEYDTSIFANAIDSYLNEQINQLLVIQDDDQTRTLLASSSNGGDGEKEEARLSRMQVIEKLLTHQQEYPEVFSLLLENADHTVVAATDPSLVGTFSPFPTAANCPEEQRAVISPIVVNSPSLRIPPYFVLGFPIRDHLGYEGNLVEIIGLSAIQELAVQTGMFTTGSRMVIDDQGTIIASSEGYDTKMIEELADSSDLPALWAAIDIAKTPKDQLEYSENGVRRIGYYQHIDAWGWTVFIGVNRAEIFRPTLNALPVFLLFALFLIIGLSIVLHQVSDSISSPVQELIEGMEHIKSHDYHYQIKYNANYDFDDVINTFNNLMEHISKNTEDLKRLNQDLNAITTNVPGGLFKCSAQEGFPFDFLSNSYVDLLGCVDLDEVKSTYGNFFINTVYPADRDMVSKELSLIENHRGEAKFEYRMERDGSKTIWINCTVRQMIDSAGANWFYGMAVDATERHKAFEQLRKSEDRYRIIMEQTEDLLFEWDIRQNCFAFFSNEMNWIRAFGTSVRQDGNLMEGSFLDMYPEDRVRFKQALEKMVTKHQKRLRIDVRLARVVDGQSEYFWNSFHLAVIFDDENNPERITGTILDVNSEKLEAMRLIGLSQTDPLTGLLNRRGMQTKIESVLNYSSIEHNTHVLIMLDIDSFKAVNDTLGHLAGDSVLIAIAKCIRGTFRNSDFFGRLGGDEFAIFLNNFSDSELLEKKVIHLLSGFSRLSLAATVPYPISCSAGIALFPKDGITFDELYKRADDALYEVKRSGKNGYAFADGLRKAII